MIGTTLEKLDKALEERSDLQPLVLTHRFEVTPEAADGIVEYLDPEKRARRKFTYYEEILMMMVLLRSRT